MLESALYLLLPLAKQRLVHFAKLLRPQEREKKNFKKKASKIESRQLTKERGGWCVQEQEQCSAVQHTAIHTKQAIHIKEKKKIAEMAQR